MDKQDQINEILILLNRLSNFQLDNIKGLCESLSKEFIYLNFLKESDFASEIFVRSFGDILRVHHFFSREPFTKDKFEHAFVRTLNYCGISSHLAPRGHAGYDMVMNDIKVSLKTQGDSSIKPDRIHISKFMELGKGSWVLQELLGRYINHMKDYQRIFTLRCLSNSGKFQYELVEIPMNLLHEAVSGKIYTMESSRQTPKPGYCDVKEENGELKFRLYFDGGTERKLQVKDLNKKFCKVHANWVF